MVYPEHKKEQALGVLEERQGNRRSWHLVVGDKIALCILQQ